MKNLQRFPLYGMALAVLLTLAPQEAFAMHIMEGFLPPFWALAWWLMFLPCLVIGATRLKNIVRDDSDKKVLLALWLEPKGV